MKKAIVIFLFLICSLSALAKDKTDTDSFLGLDRYIQTFEINDEAPLDIEEENSFEDEAIEEVSKRYEENAVELKLDSDSYNALNILNRERIFSLRINEDKFNIENSIRAENMIWDSSKAFSQAFLIDSRHMVPIPSVINSSRLLAQSGKNISASLGQTNLYDANGPSALFIRSNESTYNMGSVISYKGDGLMLSAGSFSSSYNHAASGGFLISTDSVKLPYNAGSVIVGGGYFANEEQTYDKTTGGGFIEYSFRRLKLNAQIGQSYYSNSINSETSLYFIPEYKISDNLYIKTRFIRNVTADIMQNELALSFRPKNNPNNVEFEINTSNQYTQNENINRRIKFSTTFKF